MMRLKKVELINWKQHEKKEIEFDDKTTVIYGPNGVGKSNLFEAIHRGLFDRHGSNDQKIKRIEPFSSVGGVSSTVKITFSLRGVTYIVEKTFNYNQGTKLYEIREGKPRLISKNDKADFKVIEMLEAEMQTRGASGPSKWGAFYWLWALQDERDLPSEGDPTSVLHLDKSDGQVLVTPKFQYVQAYLRKVYTDNFKQDGDPRKHSPMDELQEDLKDLFIEKQRLEMRIGQIEEQKQNLEIKLQELPKFMEALESNKEKQKEAYASSQEFIRIEEELKTCKSKISELKLRVKNTTDAIERLRVASKKVRDLQERNTEIRNLLSGVELECSTFELQLGELTKKIDEKTDEVGNIDLLEGDARSLYSIKDNQNKIDEIEGKFARINAIEIEVANLQALEKPLVVSETELKELEEDETKLKINRMRLSESSLMITRTPGSDDVLGVVVDDQELDKDILEANTVKSVIVRYTGLGEVSIRADLEEAHNIQAEIKLLKSKLSSHTKRNFVSSVAELRNVFEENNRIANTVQALNAERRGIDARTTEELQGELNRLNSNLERYSQYERTSYVVENNPVDVDLGELVRRRESEKRTVEEEWKSLRDERDALNQVFSEKKDNRANLRAKLESVDEQISHAIEEQQELVRKFGSEEIQTAQLEKEQGELDAESLKLSGIEAEYKEFAEGPIAIIRRLETTIKQQEIILQNHRASIEQIRGAINKESREGFYSELSSVESKTESISETLERESIKADALSLLRSVLDEQYLEALHSVTEPIKQDVAYYLGYVTGNRHETVELNDDLFPVRLGERGYRELVMEFAEASSGLREILTLCVRLAVAKHLCSEEPQCLVLDDPFVHVSTDRSEPMIELINSVGEETGLQVVVLTHRQMEFAGFAGKLVDIQGTS